MLSSKHEQRRPPPAVGDVNILEATLGQRGKGKSTHQCFRAWQLAHEYSGAYVIGHSLGGRLPKRLPPELGGAELPIVYYTTIEQLDRGLRAQPQKWHILAPPLMADREHVRATCDDLLRYSIRLSESIRDAAYERHVPLLQRKARGVTRDYTGVPCAPIVMIVDEGIAVESAQTGARGKHDDNRWFLEYLYSLRHYHIALLYAIQNPNARSYQLLSEATTIYVFYLRHAWALGAVQAAGATREQIDEIRSLPPYEYVVIDDVSASPDEIERAVRSAANAPAANDNE